MCTAVEFYSYSYLKKYWVPTTCKLINLGSGAAAATKTHKVQGSTVVHVDIYE